MDKLFEAPLFKKVSKLADFFLASLLWILFSLPVITVVPASIALYYAVAKVARYESGDSIIKSFLHSFKDNLRQGLWVSLLYAAAGIVLYTFFDVSRGVGFETLFSRVYLLLLVVYSIGLVQITLFLIPVLSRFQIRTLDAIKLSIRLLRMRYLRIIPYTIAVFGLAVISYLIPPLILVFPGGFCYSLSFHVERNIRDYLEQCDEDLPDQPDWITGETYE